MTLAGYDLTAIEAGRFALDGGAMFGIVPRTLWSRHIAPDDQNRIPMTARCLLLRGHGRIALVDTGMGDKHDEKFARIYDAGPFLLLNELARLGVLPEDVTDVFLTHLHFDHVGGAISRTEAGGLELTFPNATHHVQAAHWTWAYESPREGASFLAENLEPLEASGKLNLLQPDDPSPLPHTEIVVVDGHTRGQQLLLIRDGAEAVFFAGDLLPTAAHVPLLWIMAYDIAPLDTLAEKDPILARAAQEGWTVVFEHDVNVATGRVEVGPRGYSVVDPQPSLG